MTPIVASCRTCGKEMLVAPDRATLILANLCGVCRRDTPPRSPRCTCPPIMAAERPAHVEACELRRFVEALPPAPHTSSELEARERARERAPRQWEALDREAARQACDACGRSPLLGSVGLRCGHWYGDARCLGTVGMRIAATRDRWVVPLASLPAETQDPPMDNADKTPTDTHADAIRAVEDETRKTRPERARGLVEGLGEPIALVVAGWLMIEADAAERRIDMGSLVREELRELARALQDAATEARGTLEP